MVVVGGEGGGGGGVVGVQPVKIISLILSRQSLDAAKTGDPQNKPPCHSQAELGLSHCYMSCTKWIKSIVPIAMFRHV